MESNNTLYFVAHIVTYEMYSDMIVLPICEDYWVSTISPV